MTIKATVVADSIGANAPRITTFQLRYPRFIHSELMTHRVFSRNASSSRAIPVERLIEDIERDTAMPIHWGKNIPGMQAKEENNELVSVLHFGSDGHWFGQVSREKAWLNARDRAIEVARAFHAAGYHKQIVNRILEPFTHINVIVTATNYANFYALRNHEDAQPEIKELAQAMLDAHKASRPTFLNNGEWHLPYVTEEDRTEIVQGYIDGEGEYGGQHINRPVDELIACSVARCARVSYLTHDGKKPTVKQDIALYDRLLGSVPLHASPAEHQATPDVFVINDNYESVWANPDKSGNLDHGWVQYRKLLKNETHYTYEGLN